ncbi:MAG: hypothetical protein HYW62_04570 [Candidatus Levybacteria bacterium]|nr:hypothetical protein [Candidatus Levybacteria bacterium]
MLTKFYKHSLYYVFLVVILSLGFLLTQNNSNKTFQIGVVVVTTFFYVLWGIMHHLINHDLSIKIVIEYILIGSFGLAIIFFLLATSGNY